MKFDFQQLKSNYFLFIWGNSPSYVVVVIYVDDVIVAGSSLDHIQSIKAFLHS